MEEKKEKYVKFESWCNGKISCTITGANMTDLLTSIGVFINHCYNYVFTEEIEKAVFKEMFLNACKDEVFFKEEKSKKSEHELDIDELKILIDLLKKVSDK